jgi:hypothetical protein
VDRVVGGRSRQSQIATDGEDDRDDDREDENQEHPDGREESLTSGVAKLLGLGSGHGGGFPIVGHAEGAHWA